MAQTIKIKRSDSASAPSSLVAGELAYSGNSDKLFIGHPDGSTGVITIGGTYYTAIVDGAASANTASKLVLRDGSGNFSAGTITANLTGNVSGSAGTATGLAGSATVLATARSIGGVSFNGSADINLPGVNASGNQNTSGNSATVTGGVYTSGAQTIAGAKTFSSSILGNLTGNVTGNTSGSSGSTTGNAATVTGGVYTSGDQTIAGVKTFSSAILADLTGDVTGNVSGSAGTATGLAGSATILANGRTLAITGDIAYTSPSFNGSANVTAAGTLATVNSNVGSFGTTTAIPVVTVNAKGLVTAVSTAAIVTSWNLDADSGTTNAVAGGETLTVAGGTGVATSVSGNTVSIAVGQAVATDSNVTFNNVAVDGTLTSDDIQATTLTASGHVIVTGNLTVNGTTTTVNSNTVAIGDAIMTLNSDETGTPSANAGLEVERGTSANASILWNEAGNYWQTTDGAAANVTSQLLTAGNFAATFTGILDGGSF